MWIRKGGWGDRYALGGKETCKQSIALQRGKWSDTPAVSVLNLYAENFSVRCRPPQLDPRFSRRSKLVQLWGTAKNYYSISTSNLLMETWLIFNLSNLMLQVCDNWRTSSWNQLRLKDVCLFLKRCAFPSQSCAICPKSKKIIYPINKNPK